MSKWMDKLTRKVNTYDPRKRKQYRKARFRKRAKRFEDFCKREEEKAEELDRLHPNWLIEMNSEIFIRTKNVIGSRRKALGSP